MSKFADTLIHKDGVFAARRDDTSKWVRLSRKDAHTLASRAPGRPWYDQPYGLLVYVRSPWAKEWKGQAEHAGLSQHEAIAVSKMNPQGLAPAYALWDWGRGRLNQFPSAPAVLIDDTLAVRESAGQWFIVEHGNWGTEPYATAAAAKKVAMARTRQRVRQEAALHRGREKADRKRARADAVLKAGPTPSAAAMAQALEALYLEQPVPSRALSYLAGTELAAALLGPTVGHDQVYDLKFWAGELVNRMVKAVGENPARRALLRHAPRLAQSLGETAPPRKARKAPSTLRFAKNGNGK